MKSASRPLEDGLHTGRAIRRRLAALDPVIDHEEATHLSVEVLYGDAVFVHAAYLVAFMRQVAIPSISRIVYRSGTGDMMHDVTKRTDDTLTYFGEMLRRGHSHPLGRAAIERMELIHSRFGISADDKLYTLASLAFEADRIVAHLGLDPFTDEERISRYRFWRGVGERMHLNVPDSRERFLAWAVDYEQRYAYTDGGRILVDELFRDWQRWFPGRLQRYSDEVLLLFVDAPVRAAHRLPDPNPRHARLAPKVIGPYLSVQQLRPHRTQRSWVDHFGRAHARPLDFTTIGHRLDRAAERRRVRAAG